MTLIAVRALCLHGHYYQPPREHPWLGVVEPDASAAPARDWNARIAAECYAPHAAARGAARRRPQPDPYRIRQRVGAGLRASNPAPVHATRRAHPCALGP